MTRAGRSGSQEIVLPLQKCLHRGALRLIRPLAEASQSCVLRLNPPCLRRVDANEISPPVLLTTSAQLLPVVWRYLHLEARFHKELQLCDRKMDETFESSGNFEPIR